MAGEHICVAASRLRKLFVAPDNLHSLPDDAIEAAITHVLEAEAAARADIISACSEATEIAEEARERARRLAVHTDRRIHSMRAAFADKATAVTAALEAEAAALGVAHDLTPREVLRVEKAVAALARGLTGGSP
jgi:vacuolar-type H+-ATPase subunit H